jgi:hypothetical protein
MFFSYLRFYRICGLFSFWEYNTIWRQYSSFKGTPTKVGFVGLLTGAGAIL